MLTSALDPGPPAPSALTTHIITTTSEATLTPPPYLHHLAAQVLHNLQHQHEWRSLQIHTHADSATSKSPFPTSSQQLHPRPLISGIPPHRIYTHPDLQLELIRRGLREEDLRAERMWVCPSHLRERWTLEMFAGVFDGLPLPNQGVEEKEEDGEENGDGKDGEQEGEVVGGKWDEVKRMLLATVEDDSTVVYYVVHDGIVKPRQN